MKRITGLLITLLVVSLIAGCAQQKIAEKEPIKIGVDVFPGWGHIFIAQEKGFFKKNGVDVEIILSHDYLITQEQFINDELDGVFMVYADAIYSHSNGINLKVVYISDHSVTGDVIVAKPEFRSMKDLKGKIVGVEGINSFSHLFVLAVLEKNGLKETDIFIKNVNAQHVVDALEKGEIDAGHTYGAGIFEAEKKGYSHLAFAGDVHGIITDVLVFHKKILEERPKEIKAILRSLFEAKKFQETDREEALEIIAEAIKDTPESVARGIDAVDYLDLGKNIYAMIEEEEEEEISLIELGKLIADFYLKRGQLASLMDLNEIIEPRFVNELSQE